MGKSSSKFRKFVRSGDEVSAVQLLMTSSELRRVLDPNVVYKSKSNVNHDTALHCVCQHAMSSLVRIMMKELGGNPNRKNVNKQTALHCVCQVTDAQNVNEAKRAECLQLLLEWLTTSNDGNVSTADINAVDDKGNTCLHYAAMSGMKDCVQLLVSHGACVYTENENKQTPCDCAEQSLHSQLALFLESKMVFSEDKMLQDEQETQLHGLELDEVYCGLRTQELQQEKDQLIVETADMLQVPLFTAEALLRNHEWSRELLLESWIADPVSCCNKCGVLPPNTTLSTQTFSLVSSTVVDPDSVKLCTQLEHYSCEICLEVIDSIEDIVALPCHHQFCTVCWQQYLTWKILDGETHNITCPGYQCDHLVPVDIIERHVSRDMARRYLQFDIKAFVETNPTIKWCPHPGCGRAVKFPLTNYDNSSTGTVSQPFTLSMSASKTSHKDETGHAVDCGIGHTFCWDCLGEAHAPASCEHWKNWHQKIIEVKPEQISGTEEEVENSANCLWLVTNSKPCSSCKSPIQKNEGCNHMKCSKCKHDFCWVCLESWKKHSTVTGGYFRCNRYEVVRKVAEQKEVLITEAEQRNKHMQELNRFVHYYSRFKNHENSYKLELPLYETAREKMLSLARAVFSDETLVEQQTQFIREAVRQLLQARHVLKCSYVYGYYLEQTGYKKPIFEFMQTELEECTETLSQMVSRPYLRTPRTKIIQAAYNLLRKHHEFLTAISKGLIPPDISPSLKKKSKIFSVEVDDTTRKVLLTSLHNDPHTTWVKGPSGKHTNVCALLDWPDDSDDSDPETSITLPPSVAMTTTSTVQYDSTTMDTADSQGSVSTVGHCKRSGCLKLRVLSPLTGQLHDYCSMKCKVLDSSDSVKVINESVAASVSLFAPDYEFDLLRAVEMSRLQYQAEVNRTMAVGREYRSIGDYNVSSTQQKQQTVDVDLQEAIRLSQLPAHNEQCDLKLAIELSLKDISSSHNDIDAVTGTGTATGTGTGTGAGAGTATATGTGTVVVAAAATGGGVFVDDELNAAMNGNMFGPIKDLQVNNIVASDADKMMQFDSKNFKQLFSDNVASL